MNKEFVIRVEIEDYTPSVFWVRDDDYTDDINESLYHVAKSIAEYRGLPLNTKFSVTSEGHDITKEYIVGYMMGAYDHYRDAIPIDADTCTPETVSSILYRLEKLK